jgi:hypothetical protein
MASQSRAPDSRPLVEVHHMFQSVGGLARKLQVCFERVRVPGAPTKLPTLTLSLVQGKVLQLQSQVEELAEFVADSGLHRQV